MTVLKGFDFSKPDNLQAAESNEQEEHFLRYVKAGESIQVGLLSPNEYAQVKVYDIYPLTGTIGIPEDDLIKKAKSEVMRVADNEKAYALQITPRGQEPTKEEIKEATDAYKKMSQTDKEAFKKGAGSRWYELIKEAYRLDVQERFLFGFYDFATGKPFVMQTTKKQAEGIYKKIAEANTAPDGGQASVEMFAYKVTKGTGGFALDLDTTKMLMTMPQEEKDKHAEYRKQEISVEEFDNAHFKLSVEGQQEVLSTFASAIPEMVISNVFTKGESKKEEKSSIIEDQSSNVGQPLDVDESDLPF